MRKAAIATAIRLIKKAGFHPSIHGPTLYVDRHELGKFLFHVDIVNNYVDRDNLDFLLDCQRRT